MFSIAVKTFIATNMKYYNCFKTILIPGHPDGKYLKQTADRFKLACVREHVSFTSLNEALSSFLTHPDT